MWNSFKFLTSLALTLYGLLGIVKDFVSWVIPNSGAIQLISGSFIISATFFIIGLLMLFILRKDDKKQLDVNKRLERIEKKLGISEDEETKKP